MTEYIPFDLGAYRKKLEFMREHEMLSIKDFAAFMNISEVTLRKLLDENGNHVFSYDIRRRMRDRVQKWEADNGRAA